MGSRGAEQQLRLSSFWAGIGIRMEKQGGALPLYLMLKAVLGAEDGFPILHRATCIRKT